MTDNDKKELSHAEIWTLFRKEYGINTDESQFKLLDYQSTKQADVYEIKISIDIQGQQIHLSGHGNGLLSASMNALNMKWSHTMSIAEYSEHTLGKYSTSRSISYICCSDYKGNMYWGVAIDTDIATASIQALLNAFHKMHNNVSFSQSEI